MERKHTAFKNHREVTTDPSLNIDIQYFYYDLEEKLVELIKRQVLAALESFQCSFYRLDVEPHNKKRKIINIYVFPSREEYEKIGPRIPISVENGGIAYTMPQGDCFKVDLYVFAVSAGIHNLQHEITHALMCDVAPYIPPVLVEGLADYIEHGCEKVKRERLQNALAMLDGINGLEDVLKIKAGRNLYYGGLLLVSFFETEHSDFLDRKLKRVAAEGEFGEIDSENYEAEFSDWLLSLNLDLSARDALKVERTTLIRDGIWRAALTDGALANTVGMFPDVEYMFFHDTLRGYCHGTRDYIDVSPEFTYMKLVPSEPNQHGHKYFGTLCDKTGLSYYSTAEFLLQTKRFFPDKLPATNSVEMLDKQIRNLTTDSINRRELHRNLAESQAAELVEIGQRLAETPWISYLRQIDLRKISPDLLDSVFARDGLLKTGVSSESEGENKIFSAVSVYTDEGEKVGELQTGVGLFVGTEDGRYTFVYNDSAVNMHIRYNTACYVTKDESENCLRFVSEVTSAMPPLLKLNRLFRLDPSCVTGESYRRLKPNVASLAQEVKLMKSGDYSIERGRLLDCRGTDSKFDNVHEAVLKKGDDVVTVLKFVGVYSIRDTIFIHDFGKGTRHQLPDDVRCLKLVRDESGLIYLSPWSQEKRRLWDENVLVDPAIIHTYDDFHDKRKAGLVDIAAYAEGTIFECRPRDGMVELYTDGNLVGRAVAEQHTFLNDTFISVDFNYSFVDFMASRLPTIQAKDDYFKFTAGEGDYPTDFGYTRHQRLYITLPEKNKDGKNK